MYYFWRSRFFLQTSAGQEEEAWEEIWRADRSLFDVLLEMIRSNWYRRDNETVLLRGYSVGSSRGARDDENKRAGAYWVFVVAYLARGVQAVLE